VLNNISNNKYTKKFDQEYTPPYRKPYLKLTDSQKKTNKIKRTLAIQVSAPGCEVCGEDKMKRLTLHHHRYFPDSIVYKNYKTQTDVGDLEYYEALEWEVRSRPWNFSVLCNQDHEEVEALLEMGKDIGRYAINAESYRLQEKIKEFNSQSNRSRLARWNRIDGIFSISMRARIFAEHGVWITV
jgi:hypothetical protein